MLPGLLDVLVKVSGLPCCCMSFMLVIAMFAAAWAVQRSLLCGKSSCKGRLCGKGHVQQWSQWSYRNSGGFYASSKHRKNLSDSGSSMVSSGAACNTWQRMQGETSWRGRGLQAL